MDADDVGGVHVKYLYHCPRQLWLYVRGVRPEHLSPLVELGAAVHDTSYARHSPVDLGAARLDHLDGETWVHETKSSSRPSAADEAQVRHYCYRLHLVGVPAQGAILRYPTTRRTRSIPYDNGQAARADEDVRTVLDTAARSEPPVRLPQSRCRGCSFFDYCWTE